MPSSGGLVALPEILHITRRQPIRPPVATLVEFHTLFRLTHSPLRRNARLEVVPLAGGRVVQADITELDRPGRDETPPGALEGFVSFVSTGFKCWEIFTVGSVSFVSKVFGQFAFYGRPDRSSALPLAQTSSSMFTFFFFKAFQPLTRHDTLLVFCQMHQMGTDKTDRTYNELQTWLLLPKIGVNLQCLGGSTAAGAGLGRYLAHPAMLFEDLDRHGDFLGRCQLSPLVAVDLTHFRAVPDVTDLDSVEEGLGGGRRDVQGR